MPEGVTAGSPLGKRSWRAAAAAPAGGAKKLKRPRVTGSVTTQFHDGNETAGTLSGRAGLGAERAALMPDLDGSGAAAEFRDASPLSSETSSGVSSGSGASDSADTDDTCASPEPSSNSDAELAGDSAGGLRWEAGAVPSDNSSRGGPAGTTAGPRPTRSRQKTQSKVREQKHRSFSAALAALCSLLAGGPAGAPSLGSLERPAAGRALAALQSVLRSSRVRESAPEKERLQCGLTAGRCSAEAEACCRGAAGRPVPSGDGESSSPLRPMGGRGSVKKHSRVDVGVHAHCLAMAGRDHHRSSEQRRDPQESEVKGAHAGDGLPGGPCSEARGADNASGPGLSLDLCALDLQMCRQVAMRLAMEEEPGTATWEPPVADATAAAAAAAVRRGGSQPQLQPQPPPPGKGLAALLWGSGCTPTMFLCEYWEQKPLLLRALPVAAGCRHVVSQHPAPAPVSASASASASGPTPDTCPTRQPCRARPQVEPETEMEPPATAGGEVKAPPTTAEETGKVARAATAHVPAGNCSHSESKPGSFEGAAVSLACQLLKVPGLSSPQAVLRELLGRSVGCPPAPADSTDALAMYVSLRDELGGPLVQRQDVSLVKTVRSPDPGSLCRAPGRADPKALAGGAGRSSGKQVQSGPERGPWVVEDAQTGRLAAGGHRSHVSSSKSDDAKCGRSAAPLGTYGFGGRRREEPETVEVHYSREGGTAGAVDGPSRGPTWPGRAEKRARLDSPNARPPPPSPPQVALGESIPAEEHQAVPLPPEDPGAAAVTAQDCRRAHASGYTVALRALQYRCREVADASQALASDFGQASVGANLYLTPPAAQGLDLHRDDHCVFVCQLAGRKEWRVAPPLSGPGLLPRLYSNVTLELPTRRKMQAREEEDARGMPASVQWPAGQLFLEGEVAGCSEGGRGGGGGGGGGRRSEGGSKPREGGGVRDARAHHGALPRSGDVAEVDCGWERDANTLLEDRWRPGEGDALARRYQLEPEDMLYIPRGWLHEARTVHLEPPEERQRQRQQQLVGSSRGGRGGGSGGDEAEASKEAPVDVLDGGDVVKDEREDHDKQRQRQRPEEGQGESSLHVTFGAEVEPPFRSVQELLPLLPLLLVVVVVVVVILLISLDDSHPKVPTDRRSLFLGQLACGVDKMRPFQKWGGTTRHLSEWRVVVCGPAGRGSFTSGSTCGLLAPPREPPTGAQVTCQAHSSVTLWGLVFAVGSKPCIFLREATPTGDGLAQQQQQARGGAEEEWRPLSLLLLHASVHLLGNADARFRKACLPPASPLYSALQGKVSREETFDSLLQALRGHANLPAALALLRYEIQLLSVAKGCCIGVDRNNRDPETL
eukprot:jgi/Mesen1/5463/ME000273S04698